MLWKLADNVKYEDDCEVRLDRDTKRGKKVPSNKSLAIGMNMVDFFHMLWLLRNGDNGNAL